MIQGQKTKSETCFTNVKRRTYFKWTAFWAGDLLAHLHHTVFFNIMDSWIIRYPIPSLLIVKVWPGHSFIGSFIYSNLHVYSIPSFEPVNIQARSRLFSQTRYHQPVSKGEKRDEQESQQYCSRRQHSSALRFPTMSSYRFLLCVWFLSLLFVNDSNYIFYFAKVIPVRFFTATTETQN